VFSSSKSNNFQITSDQCKRQVGRTHDLQYVSIAVCAVSCMSSLFIFLGYLVYKRETRNSPRLRLLLYMNIFGFIYSLCLGIEAILLSLPMRLAYDYPFCQIQAFIANSTSLALNCWSLAFTLYVAFDLVLSNTSFQQLQKWYYRIEYIFLFLCLLVIPLPFFVMMFPIPVIGSKPLRFVLLYGHSDKQWCDFSNARKPFSVPLVPFGTQQVLDPIVLNSWNTSIIHVHGNGNSNGSIHTIINNHMNHNSAGASKDNRIEYSWALWWELGFFYVPNAILFLISMILYIRILIKIRQNSVQLERRRRTASIMAVNSLEITTPAVSVPHPMIPSLNTFPDDHVATATAATAAAAINTNTTNRTSGTPSHNNALSKMNNIFNISDDNMKNMMMITPIAAAAAANIASSTNGVSSSLNHNNPIEEQNYRRMSEQMQWGLQPFHFRLSGITLNDIEEYKRFLQSQARIAAYYIGALMINWIISVVARIIWEFGECNWDDKASRVLFISLLVIMECSGPRIECILLSLIYGIAENTVSPNSLRDVFVDLVSLKYFREYCFQLSLKQSHRRRGKLYGTISNETMDHLTTPIHNNNNNNNNREDYDEQRKYGSIVWNGYHWLRKIFVKNLSRVQDRSKNIDQSNTMTHESDILLDRRDNFIESFNDEYELDDLLFFWFDVQKMRDVMEKRRSVVGEYNKLVQQLKQSISSPYAPIVDRQTIYEKCEQLKPQIEFYRNKIFQYAREICSIYFSESAPLPIQRSGIVTNFQRNRIRTIVLQEAYATSDEDEEDAADAEEEEDPMYEEYNNHEHDSDSNNSVDERTGNSNSVRSAQNSDSEMDHFADNTSGNRLHFKTCSMSNNNTHNNNNNKGNNGCTTTIGDETVTLLFIQSNREEKVLKLFMEPQAIALQKLNRVMNGFKNSTLFQELNHVLRMKAVSKSRSLYRDILNRLFILSGVYLRKCYSGLCSICCSCMGNFSSKIKFNRRRRRNGKRGSNSSSNNNNNNSNAKKENIRFLARSNSLYYLEQQNDDDNNSDECDEEDNDYEWERLAMSTNINDSGISYYHSPVGGNGNGGLLSIGHRYSTSTKRRTQRNAIDHKIKITDMEIYAYVKEQKRVKVLKKQQQQQGIFNSF
jgi:hypothetical protein